MGKKLYFSCTKELFSEAIPHNFSLKLCSANIQQNYRRRPIRKFNFNKVASTCSWVLYCKFATDLQSIFLEEHLLKTVSVFCVICFLVQVINNTFYWLAFIKRRPAFLNCRLIKKFFKVFFISFFIVRNNFFIAC